MQIVIQRILFRRSGVTLVELLTASVLMVIIISALFAVLRNGGNAQLDARYRQRALALLDSSLESNRLCSGHYDILNLSMDVCSYSSVTIDNRGTSDLNDDIIADLYDTVYLPSGSINQNRISSNNGNDFDTIPRSRIVALISWNGINGSDTLSLEKWITNVSF